MSRKVSVILPEVVVLFLLVATSALAQQPKLRTLSEQELADMMLGTAIQSSRGDNTAAHVAELKKALAQGKKFQMISLEDLPDDWTIVSTYDGRVDATAPDTMTPLDPKTAGTVNGLTDGTVPVGAEVIMVGFPADPRWRTPKGIEYFGPRHEGFDFDYVPIEQLQKARNNPPVR